ncbi:cell division protein FtsZ [Bartonella tamiae]|uniref:Cell division protein FtsZ n=2 Tax=Bartonella tamiae TaxID=373638 RepID=J0R0L8_9HYPH|nr:cell division protein FtsZ [Bartonella tamiae]EJF89059.1 cell division protein FtsZ [Bartonella tamiae Th239]EJF94691.1 cell division protein FtsZ [Bartonella tamiae Th307]
MTINLHQPDITELKPRISVFGVGGGGGNAVNNMINAGMRGVDFVVANTDAQALTMSKADRVIQLGAAVTEGLGAGALPEVGQAAAEECLDEIKDYLGNSHMVFITCGMGGGTGTGAAPVVARAAREKGILTVGVVTKPFHFEGARRMKTAEAGIEELQKSVDTLIVIPNQNLFRIANEKTTFADAFMMADQVLYSGVASITDLMIKEGLINLDFADVRSVMHEMGRAMMGTGEASGEGRALAAAEAAIANPLLDETSMRGARGLLISITGGRDLTLFEVDEAANRIREEVDSDANVIFGAIDDESLEGVVRVSVVATGIDRVAADGIQPGDFAAQRMSAPIRKQEAATASKPVAASAPKSESRHESMVEVMEALEVEINQPVNEPFRPKSQIFKSPTSQVGHAQQRSHAQAPAGAYAQMHNNSGAHSHANSHHAGGQAQAFGAPRMGGQAVPQQHMTQQVSMEATARVLEEPAQNEMVDNAFDVSQENSSPRQVQRSAPARMPELSDFPSVGREQMAASHERSTPQPGPRSLWQKLTQSLMHRDEAEPTARLEPASNPSPRRPSMPQMENRRAISPDANVYAPRRNADNQVRPQPQQQQQRSNMSEEDQLEIPAFLRRQSH